MGKVIGNPQRADDLAQIGADRLATRHGDDSPLLDRSLHSINLVIRRHDSLGECRVAVDDRVDRIGNLLFNKAAHLRDLETKFTEFRIEGVNRVLHL